jgi:3-oxoacyl-(acyl-carrier-protein) synthase
LHQHLTEGGATLVGLENCGLDVLEHGAAKILDGTHEVCYCGATEEYSPIVEDVYNRIGWYCGEVPSALPRPLGEGERVGVGVSEGSVFAILAAADSSPVSGTASRACVFTAVETDAVADVNADLIVSGAGGGPHDVHELAVLRAALTGRGKPLPVLFSKRFFGETFAVGPMLSLAVAWDMLTTGASYPLSPVTEELSSLVADSMVPSEVSSALILSASREGAVSAGLLQKLHPDAMPV